MITLCWEAEKITITKEELTLLTRHVRVPQTLKGNNMWKLIDCGTYPWFIKKSQKFYHCVYGLDGEFKKIKIQFKKYNIRLDNDIITKINLIKTRK